MRKIAFIYPGQGAQAIGMGKSFYDNSELAKELFELADESLDVKVSELCFNENEMLNQTQYTQPALVTTCLSITREILSRGIKPDVTAGLSLGEYAAIAVAGGMTEVDAIKAVRARGTYMENACPAGLGAMCAVLGLMGDEIEAAIADIDGVYIANYNCPGQIVITGEKNAVELAMDKLKEAGEKRCIPLNVSGPFHSPLLNKAGEDLYTYLEQIEMKELEIPYITNVTADYVSDKKYIKGLLVKQVTSSVRFEQSINRMIKDGVDTFVEIGPGKTLAGFIRKINKDVRVINISDIEDLEKLDDIA